ncbi:DNA polymerase I [Nocardia altamirensis]|uniref:DNA polymerase I n=1 Tax=Nocardia altamirensis TaxID=472158 RepID=UPI00084070E2|nr:DNA polymerase I [Nocardia altamirensis]
MSSPDQVPTLAVLDIPSLLAHAFRTVAPIAAVPAEEQINAVSGCTTTILAVLAAFAPTHVAAVFDTPGPLTRANIQPDYQPSAVVTDLVQQLDRMRELVQAMGIAVVDAPPGLEAADQAAAFAQLCPAHVENVVIASIDDRVLQCLTDSVVIARPGYAGALDTLTPATICRSHGGITPNNVPDYLALRGDLPRGMAPVPGVGEATVAKWLTQYRTLDGLIADIDNVPGRPAAVLRAHTATVTARRDILRLGHDLPSPPLTALATGTHRPDPDRITRLLGNQPTLSASVLDALALTAHSAPSEPVPSGHVQEWLATRATGTGRCTLALETQDSRLHAIAISTPTGHTGHIELAATTSADKQALGAWIADSSVTKTVHDTKATVHALREHHWTPAGISMDTALASYLLHPGEGTSSPSLTEVADRHLHRETPPTAETLFDLGDEPAHPPVVTTAQQIGDLASVLGTELDRAGMTTLLTTTEIPLAAILAEIENHGVSVDATHLQDLRSEFSLAAGAATEAATQFLGRPINLGSAAQLRAVLFDELALPPTRRIKQGYSTAAEDLTRLQRTTGGHPFLELILAHRSATKLISNIDSLLTHRGPDNRIHTTLHQMVTSTGRLSSADPNLQNIPIRTPDGRRLREAVVPGAGFDLLMSADYSQIELRIMAHLSGDELLIDAFTSGEDLHNYVAGIAFGIPTADVDAEHRRRAKAIGYGLAYGLTPRGLASQLDIPIAEARTLIGTYFSRFGRVRDYLNDLVEVAAHRGYTESLLGRRRYLPELTSNDGNRVEAATRAALNAPIQGSAADIIKRAMVDIDRAITERGLRARMTLQIHDELLFELPATERDELTAVVRDAMASAVKLAVPLEVSIGTGATWAAAHHS